MQLLDKSDIDSLLDQLDGWTLLGNTIEKEFQLKNFSEALAFTVQIGIAAEKVNHHPDILIYGWNKVKLTLSTHSAGGLTQNDFNLASVIDKL